MRTSIDPAALAAATVAAALTVLYTEGDFGLWDFAIGLTLAMLLFSYNTGRHRRRWQSAAFAAVAAFALTIIIGCILQWSKLKADWWWLPAAWAVSFLVVFIIDRLRAEPDDDEYLPHPAYVRHAAPPRRPVPIRPRPVPAYRPPPRRRPPPVREEDDDERETLCSPFCWCDC